MTRDEHPDEGTIHAWLDGELDPSSAKAIAGHVKSCASCEARVAEARGLIAGASRVVGALDDVPVASPSWGGGAERVAARGATSAWRRLRLTPTRAAIAATLLVAAGVTLNYQRTGPDTVVARTESASTTPTDSAGASGVRPARDALLDSAVKRNIAAAQPPRTVEAAPTRGLPVSPTLRAPLATPDTVAPTLVAGGRIAVRAMRESTSAVSDRARAGLAMAAPGAPTERGVAAAAAKAVDSSRRAVVQLPMVQSATSVPIPTECYRVESASGAQALWGSVETPFIVALEASGGGARVLTSDGVDTGTGATWSRGASDSILVQLRRTGLQGTLELGKPGDVRAGVMRSAPLQLARARARQQPRMRSDTAGGVSGTAAPGSHLADALNAAPAVPIVARRATCPSR
jgi:hypothetical protein